MAQPVQLRDRIAAHARHVELDQRRIEPAAIERGERGAAIGRPLDRVAGALEEVFDALAVRRIVVGDQQREADRRRERLACGGGDAQHRAGKRGLGHRLFDHGGKARGGEAGDGAACRVRRNEQDRRRLRAGRQAVR